MPTSPHPTPRIITADDLERAIDIPALLDEIADGFVAYSAGRVVVPPVGHLPLSDPRGDVHGDVHIKYGYIQGDDVYVIKIAAGVEENAARGLPSGDGLMLVFDRHTGFTKAVLIDHARLTDLRTAAAGAVAARALARRDIRRIGIIGAGVQGRLQLRLLAHVTSCRDVLVHNRTLAHAEAYVRDMDGAGFRVEIAPSADALARRCDLIVTATTARAPLFDADAVRPGTHVTAVGADVPGKQELDPELFRRAGVAVVDSRAQTADHGEFAHALAVGAATVDGVRELGEVLADPSRGRTSDDEITLCDLTGVAVQDIVIARHALSRIDRA
jgi:ornithine cyclodeaminase